MIDLKEVSTEYPRTMMTPWLELKLSDDVMKHLWKSIEEGEKKPQCMKNSLAGNLSTSFALNDEDNYFTTYISVVWKINTLHRRIESSSTKIVDIVENLEWGPLRICGLSMVAPAAGRANAKCIEHIIIQS